MEHDGPISGALSNWESAIAQSSREMGLAILGGEPDGDPPFDGLLLGLPSVAVVAVLNVIASGFSYIGS